jgi:phospholipid/cholesterol/gamma-HCH transport system substrate-binding protein
MFNGVLIGSVKNINLPEKNQSTVQVIIEVSATAIMRQDCQATLASQGITGLSYVYISGGDSHSPPLVTPEDEDLPVIPAQTSSFEKITMEVPETLQAILLLANRTREILSAENEENVRIILSNLAVITTNLAGQSEQLSVKLNETMENINKAGIGLNQVIASANKLLDVNFHNAGLSAKQSFDRLDKLLSMVEPQAATLKKFFDVSFDETIRILADTRQLVQNLNSLVRSIQNDPSALFFGGNNTPEYKPR